MPSRSAIAIWLRMSDSNGLTISVGPCPVPTDPRRDPVDEALAPAGPLDDEGTLAVLGDGLDGLALALAERRARAEHGLEMALEHVVGVDGPSVTGRRHPPITGSAAATRGWALVEPAAR